MGDRKSCALRPHEDKYAVSKIIIIVAITMAVRKNG